MLFRSLFRRKHATTNDLDTPLLRCLNLFDLILLSVSGMIGSGIYVLTGVVAKDFTGPAIIISNLLAGFACLSGACCFAEFAARIPRAGSSYIYIYESIGEILAFLVGFTSIIGGLAGLGVSARVWSTYFDTLFEKRIHLFITDHIAYWPHAPVPFAKNPDLLALGITLFLIVAMLAGLRNSKWLTNSLTVLNMSALCFIGITGFILGDSKNYQPFSPFSTSNIFRGSSLLLYSYIGFEMATIAIEEAKNPAKTVPQATVISLLLVTSLYALAGASLTYLVPYSSIRPDSAFADAYGASSWPWARYVISVAIVLSAGGNLLSGAYGTIRIIYAMSTDGLLPAKLSYVSEGRHVPIVATFLACVIIAFLGTFFDIKDLIGFADISALLSYTGVSIGLLIERYNHQIAYRVVLANEDDDEDEETFQLTEGKEEADTAAEVTNPLEPDPFCTRLARSICRPCLTAIDAHLSPKTTAIILLIICVVNTSAMALLTVYLFRRDHLVHIILVALCLTIDVIVKFLFCLLPPKKHSKTLLFTCPGIPLVPLVNINIFIFLMVFQDAHDWFAYVVILLVSLAIYFAYSYRHSKSR